MRMLQGTRKVTTRRILGLLLLSGIGTVQAQSSATNEPGLALLYENEEVIEIATGTAKPIHLAPSVASVITARDIKISGVRTLDEALEMVPGLHVSLSSNRLNSVYSIRGIHTGDTPQVLLLVNGLPFNDLITGSRPPLFNLPVANISRIEIVRGPGSAVFGADAFAGVINIITRSASESHGTTVGGRAGSFDSQDGWVQYGGELNGWDTAVSVEASRSEGDRGRTVGSDLQTSFDAQFGTHASLAPGSLDTRYRVLNSSITLNREHWNIWLNSWNLRDAGVGAGAAQALDPKGSQDVDQYALVVDYSNADLVRHWTLDTRLAYRVMDQSAAFYLLPAGARVPIGADGNVGTTPHSSCSPVCMVDFPDGLRGNPGGKLTHTRLEVAGNYSGFLDHRLRLAIGVDRNEFAAREEKNFGPNVIDGTVSPIDGTLTDVTGTPYVFSPDRRRNDGYVSLQDEWRLAPDWELTAGVRHDNYSDFGRTTNPRLALVWATDYNLTSKLLYGRAFRAPSLTELYFRNNPTVIGNPNLKPETIDMLELVFDYRPAYDIETVLSLYAYQADDIIEFDSNHVAQNARSQEGHGLELDGGWQATDTLQLKGNLALQYSEDKQTGATTPNAPRYKVYLAARWRMAQTWSSQLQSTWVGDRVRPNTDARPAIRDYNLVDLALRYQPLGQRWELAAMVRNLFDTTAREPSTGTIPDDYPLAGRAVFLEARFHAD